MYYKYMTKEETILKGLVKKIINWLLLGVGFNSHSDFCALLLQKSRAH